MWWGLMCKPTRHMKADAKGSASVVLCLTLRRRTVRCVRALQKVGYFGPIFPNGHGDTVTIVFPYTHRTAQILTQSQNSDNEFLKTIFPTKHARLLSKSAVFALWA